MANQKSGATELAARYAAALFELADEAKSLDQTAADLAGLQVMLNDSPELTRLIRSPILSRAQQGQAMEAVLQAAKIAPLTQNFIGLVAANRRLYVLPVIIEAFLKDLATRRGEVGALVTSAKPLTAPQEKALTDGLKKALGAKVKVMLSVDPALIGGLLVKVGSRLIDSSVRSKLGRIELAMKGQQ